MASIAAASLIIHAPLMIATASVFIAIDIGIVGLRIWARRLKGLSLGADDYTCILSCSLLVGMAIAVIIETAYKRFGYPAQASPNSDAVPSQFAFYLSQTLQIPALGLVKISFLLFYQRVFVKSATPFFHGLCWLMIACITAWTVAYTFAFVFSCGTDFTSFWHTLARKQHCLDLKALVDSLAITDFIFDVIVIGMPLPKIWNLHLSISRKLQLSGIFLLGLVTIAASCIRLAVFIESEIAFQGSTRDLEYPDTNGQYWALVEVGLAIIAACLPTLSFFFTHEGLNSAVQSIRSALSLKSLDPNDSRHDWRNLENKTPGTSYRNDKSTHEAYKKITRSHISHTNATVESEVSYELPEIPEATLQQANGIIVDKTWTQSSEDANHIKEREFS